MDVEAQQIISFAEFELDTSRRRLLRNGSPLALYAKAFDLLAFLIEKNGELVTKNEILENVWAGQFVEEANLSVQISALRKALGESKNAPRFLITVPGKGYKFVVPASNGNREIVIERNKISHLVIEEEVRQNSQIPKRFFLQKIVFVGIIIGIILGLSWLWFFNRNRSSIASGVSAEKQINIKRLTSKGMADRAVLSPDGKFFAYSLGEKGSSRFSLWLGQTNGGRDVQLLPFAELSYMLRSFSADGNWLYYTVSEPRDFQNASLYKMQVLGGIPQKIVQGISIYTYVSPDEKLIAFVRSNEEKKESELVIAKLDGSDVKVVSLRPLDKSFVPGSLSWSLDGTLIAFAAKNGIGKGLEIFALNIGNGEVKDITNLEWTEITRLAWLSDKSGLIAVGQDKNSFDINQIWRIDYGSGKSQKIINDLLHYGSTLSLSADSNSMVTLQAILESNIWIAPSGNLSQANQITFGSSGLEGWYGMDWTADGKIIYSARIDQSLTLWEMEVNGANPKQITSVGFWDTNPSATTDGKYFVFQSNRSGEAEIWRVQKDGTDLRQLTFTGKNSMPHTTPDSQTVVYSHNSDGISSVWRVSINGGEATRITNSECENVRVSPDGKFIACGSRSEGKPKLAIFSVNNGEQIKLFDVPPTHNFQGSIRWSHDGRFICYRDWTNGIWSQAINGGEPKRLEGLPAEKLYTYEWSPDGKQFAFTRGRSVRDLVLITDFR